MLISFDEIIDITLKHEGGYVHDPKDLGGETNFGIAKRFYPEVDIKNLTKEEAKDIYRRDYWVRNKVEELPENLIHIFFDKYVNQNGDWDFDALNTDMYILNNVDKIIRGVANQYRSKGTESVINEIKNPSFTQDKQDAPQNKRSTLDMLRKEIFGK